jgi:hypothetical protein
LLCPNTQFSSAKALLKLARYSEAVTAWLAAAKLCPLASDERKHAQTAAATAHVRLQEAKGTFDWQRMWTSDSFECATFLDARVAVAQTKHGRGLTTSEPIAAGSLILVEPSIAQAHTADNVYQRHANLASAVTQKVWSDATCARVFNSLAKDGARFLNVHEDDESFIFGVRARITTNCWSVSFEKKLGEREGRICINHIGSFFNHSCAPNCTVVHVSGVQIVQANRDIERGEELTQRYCDVSANVAERSEALKNRSFVCDCPRCVRERKGPLLVPQPSFSRRPELSNEFDRFNNMENAAAAIEERRFDEAKAWLCVSLPEPLAQLCVESWRTRQP